MKAMRDEIAKNRGVELSFERIRKLAESRVGFSTRSPATGCFA